MTFDWTSEYGEIVSFLLDCLEDEHMGSSSVVWKAVVEKWNVTDEKIE